MATLNSTFTSYNYVSTLTTSFKDLQGLYGNCYDAVIQKVDKLRESIPQLEQEKNAIENSWRTLLYPSKIKIFQILILLGYSTISEEYISENNETIIDFTPLQ